MAGLAARRWSVYPDHEVIIGGERVAAVSRQAMVDAIMDGEAFLARAGGVLTVMVGRARTDLDGEAVTTGAIVEWKPGIRAEAEREAEVEVLPPDPTPEQLEAALTEGQARAAVVEELAEPDEAEDVSAIPAGQR